MKLLSPSIAMMLSALALGLISVGQQATAETCRLVTHETGSLGKMEQRGLLATQPLAERRGPITGLPYPIPTAMVKGAGDDPALASQLYAEQRVGTATYALFTNSGLFDGQFLFLGIDGDGDGLAEEVLPTGLSNMYLYYAPFRPDLIADQPPHPLTIAVDGDSITVGTYNVVLDSEPNSPHAGQVTSLQYITTQLSLPALRSDIDGDGLPAAVEAMLFLDPASADSDHDGVGDAADACPTCNPAETGPVERGVARALSTHFATRKLILPGQDFPWQAVGIVLQGCGPVSVDIGPDAWCVTLTDPDLLSTPQHRVAGKPTCHLVLVEVDAHTPFNSDELHELGLSDDQQAELVLVKVDEATHSLAYILRRTDGEYYPIATVDECEVQYPLCSLLRRGPEAS